jgi:PAS domain S-box-containing protein
MAASEPRSDLSVQACYQSARDAKWSAERTDDPARKAEFVEMERLWLSLARSYESSERPTSSTAVNSEWRRKFNERARADKRPDDRPRLQKIIRENNVDALFERMWLASIVDSTEDAIVSKNLDGIITSWNKSAQRLFGYQPEEVIGKSVTIIIPPERHHEEDMILGHIRRGECVEHFETVRQRKDGSFVDISLTVSPIRGAEQSVVGASKIARDITAQKRTEDALRDSEERLRAIFDGTYQYIGLLSTDGTLLETNRASLEFAGDAFGSKREHVVGRPFWETVWFIHTPAAPEKLREAIARAAAGEFIRYEAPLMRPSGEEVIFDFSLHPVRNTQGDVFLIVPEGRIITDRKRAEEELAKSEERLRFVADRAHVGYWHWEIAADRHEWSPLCNQFFGIPPEEPVSYARFLAALHPDDRERTDRAIRACLESGGQTDYDIEYRTLCPDETVRWIHAKGNVAFAHGKPVRMAGLALDITERKEREEREHLLVREMNHRVKNILTVVDAIANRTATGNPEDFAKRFSERIRALSANQDLLFQNEWKGVDVEDLVRAQLSHFADLIGSRILVNGPKVRLNTVGAQAIGLALHELATNASKYGALSVDRGRVDVCWDFNDNGFTMSWTECEGPSVSAPKRRGFGTTVIERMAKSSLDGTVDLDYASSGVTWRLTCPVGNAFERRNGEQFSKGRQIEPRLSMDHATILAHLSAARGHVRTGERNIARQRKLVAELEPDSHISPDAKRLLAQFEELQKLHIADRDRLEVELAEISK